MKDKKVLVAGCGGLGCYSVEMLARLSVGKITVADGDTFSPGNMNRQIYCSESTLGLNKARVAHSRWPDQVTAVDENIDEKNVDMLIYGCDVVIDALDNVKSRKLLSSHCAKAGIPLIIGGIGATACQVVAVYPEDSDILDIIYPTDIIKNVPTFSFTPAGCASMQIALARNILEGSDIKRRTLYIFDLSTMDFQAIKL